MRICMKSLLYAQDNENLRTVVSGEYDDLGKPLRSAWKRELEECDARVGHNKNQHP